MMKFAYPLVPFLEFFGGWILVIWAFRRKPHRLALEEFGIRIVAPKDYGSMDDHGDVYTALLLLKRFDLEKLEGVKKHIRIIFLRPIEGLPCYVRTGRVCHLCPPKECPAGTAPIVIAGILVYTATLAKLKKGFVPSKDVRDICKDENQRIVDKLSKELCE